MKPPKFEVKRSSKVRLNKEDDDCVSGITDQRGLFSLSLSLSLIYLSLFYIFDFLDALLT